MNYSEIWRNDRITIRKLYLRFTNHSINLMRKNEKLEDWLVDLENDLQQVENEITEADSSGGFAADDEVGTIWRTIKTSLRKLEKYTKGDNINAS